MKKALNENLKQEKLTDGIKENEAESLLEWVVQNAREGLEKTAKKSLKEIEDKLAELGLSFKKLN